MIPEKGKWYFVTNISGTYVRDVRRELCAAQTECGGIFWNGLCRDFHEVPQHLILGECEPPPPQRRWWQIW